MTESGKPVSEQLTDDQCKEASDVPHYTHPYDEICGRWGQHFGALCSDMVGRYMAPTEPDTESACYAVEAIWQFCPELVPRDDNMVLLTAAQCETILRKMGWVPPSEWRNR